MPDRTFGPLSRAERCPPAGVLHAYLDHELAGVELSAVEAHLAGCPPCAAQLKTLQAGSALVYEALGRVQAPEPATRAAWHRFEARRQARQSYPMNERLATMWQTLRYRHWRVALASLVLVGALVSIMAIDPVRAAAAQFLSIFRVQKIAVIQVDPSKMDSLKNFQEQIFSKPQVTPSKATDVASADAADSAAAYKVLMPDNVEAIAGPRTKFVVEGAYTASTTVNLAAARALFQSAGLSTDALPAGKDSLPLTASIPAVVTMRYGSGATAVTIVQAPSPEVNVPDGLDTKALAKAGLQLLGMPADQAADLSNSIDWATTLVVPVPQNAATVQQVNVHGTTGYLLTEQKNAGNSARSEKGGDQPGGPTLFWETNGMLYAVNGNLSLQNMVSIANSLK
jgi:anti-sigma factor RsiW